MKKQSLEKHDNEHCSGRKSVIVSDPVPPPKPRNGWKIAVLGAGSWGTALAVHSSLAGHNVRLWARRQLAADAMSRSRINADYLPRCEFPESLVVSADAEACTVLRRSCQSIAFSWEFNGSARASAGDSGARARARSPDLLSRG